MWQSAGCIPLVRMTKVSHIKTVKQTKKPLVQSANQLLGGVYDYIKRIGYMIECVLIDIFSSKN